MLAIQLAACVTDYAAGPFEKAKSLTSTAGRPGQPQDMVPKRKPGAQLGNKNRFKTGEFSKRNRARRREIAKLKRRVRAVIKLADAVMVSRARLE